MPDLQMACGAPAERRNEMSVLDDAAREYDGQKSFFVKYNSASAELASLRAAVADRDAAIARAVAERNEWRLRYIKRIHNQERHPADHPGICAICLQILDYLDEAIFNSIRARNDITAAILARGEDEKQHA